MTYIEFEKFLQRKGMKMTTPSGHPSTIPQYIRSIKLIMNEESIVSIEGLAKKINQLIVKYDIGGDKEAIGQKSHRTVINALKRFKDFVEEV